MKLQSKLAVEAEVIPYFSYPGGLVAGEVENIAISTQVEVVVELNLELSLAIIQNLVFYQYSLMIIQRKKKLQNKKEMGN